MVTWRTTLDDVATVLTKHGCCSRELLRLSLGLVSDHEAEIESRIQHFVDADDQIAAATDLIETILIERLVIGGPKLFHGVRK